VGYFDYFDVTDDPHAWRDSAMGYELERELRDAGFAPLGVAKAVLRRDGQTFVNQVWVSDDGRVMTKDWAELATLFEDGTIVKTMRRPSWGFFLTILTMQWRLRMHRADRHSHAFVAGPLTSVLAAHRARVAAFEKESPVVLARSMTEHFAVRLRDAELREARRRPLDLVALVLTSVTSMALAFLPVLWLLRATGWHARRLGPKLLVTFELTALIMVGIFIAALPLRYVTTTWIGPWLVRLRPGPPPRPAAALIELARDVPSGTLKAP
jgi:hypothetical protein